MHVLATNGAFLAEGRFVARLAVPQALLAETSRRAVLAFLVKHSALSQELRNRMLALRHSEFCGVDIITVDTTVPLQSGIGSINEINTAPGLHHRYNLKTSRDAEPLANTVRGYLSGRADVGSHFPTETISP